MCFERDAKERPSNVPLNPILPVTHLAPTTTNLLLQLTYHHSFFSFELLFLFFEPLDFSLSSHIFTLPLIVMILVASFQEVASFFPTFNEGLFWSSSHSFTSETNSTSSDLLFFLHLSVLKSVPYFLPSRKCLTFELAMLTLHVLNWREGDYMQLFAIYYLRSLKQTSIAIQKYCCMFSTDNEPGETRAACIITSSSPFLFNSASFSITLSHFQTENLRFRVRWQ